MIRRGKSCAYPTGLGYPQGAPLQEIFVNQTSNLKTTRYFNLLLRRSNRDEIYTIFMENVWQENIICRCYRGD